MLFKPWRSPHRKPWVTWITYSLSAQLPDLMLKFTSKVWPYETLSIPPSTPMKAEPLHPHPLPKACCVASRSSFNSDNVFDIHSHYMCVSVVCSFIFKKHCLIYFNCFIPSSHLVFFEVLGITKAVMNITIKYFVNRHFHFSWINTYKNCLVIG